MRRWITSKLIRLIVAGATVAAAGLQPSGAATAGDLKLEVSPKQASFQIPGRVVITLSFVNVSSKTIIVNRAYNVAILKDCNLRFLVVSDSGARPTEQVIFSGRRPIQYVDDDFVEIRPGQRYDEEVDLGQWFELTKVGNYIVRAEYSNGHAATPRGRPVWTGRTTSEASPIKLAHSQ